MQGNGTLDQATLGHTRLGNAKMGLATLNEIKKDHAMLGQTTLITHT